ncbi:uncharacterized protein [Amphiura filiformis]|uniref:uncharacterized protein n=1 Tax=Amphiura filiformis TaxID=82378 RepID=UPI003B223E7D
MMAFENDFENDLVSALKEVIDCSKWFCVGEAKYLKTCTRLYAEDGEDVVLIHVPPNQYFAMDASCPHEGGPLELGDVEDIDGHLCIVCPWHAFDFRLDNGESTSGLKQQTYDIRVVEGKVYIHTSAELSLDDPTQEGNIPTGVQPETDVSKSTENTLCHWAVKILSTADPIEKVTLTEMVKKKWDCGEISLVGSYTPPDQPYRVESLNVVAPGKIKRGKGGTLASRIATLHSLANIEQWAIDLSWDVIARFADTLLNDKPLPRDFFTDFVKVAADEAKHYKMLSERLHSLGSHFGALPVHNGLWQSATETKDSLLARLAVVHMVHEARGLDVHPKTQERFARQSDKESVDILEIIYTDEITHVAAGLKWFTYACRNSQPVLDCIPKFHELVKAHFRGYLKPPFNEEGRSTAGMTKEWYVPLVKPTNPLASSTDGVEKVTSHGESSNNKDKTCVR